MGAKKWKDPKSGIELTVKELDFVRLYVFGEDGIKGNASACYRAVYLQKENKDKPPSKETIWHYAWELMKKPRIKETIHVYQQELLNNDWVLNGLAQEATDKSSKASDRIRARELIGKANGMFVDKSEVNIKTDAIFSEE